MSVLTQMQSLLARLYDVPAQFAIDEFVVSERGQLPATASDGADEQVLLEDSADALSVSVYIAADVLRRLNRRNPLERLTEENLADYCTAFEGVSHFHYLTWRAASARPVSLLELELQAEVDKYVGALTLLAAQQAGQFPPTLHERLFADVRFHGHLSNDELERYKTANHYAARFCRFLDERFLRRRRVRMEAWLAELRRFYRLSHLQKLNCAAA